MGRGDGKGSVTIRRGFGPAIFLGELKMKTTATIIQMTHKATWDSVKTEYSKMTQMGWQSVQQGAKVGQMLIELKANCEHGEFKAKVQRVALLNYRTASNLMLLASNSVMLEQHMPNSQAAAMRLITEAQLEKKATTEKVLKKISWTRAVLDYGDTGLDQRQLSGRKEKIQELLGYAIPPFFDGDGSAERAAKFAVDVTRVMPPDKPSGKTTKNVNVEQIVALENAKLQKSFLEEVYKEVDRRIPDIKKAREEAIRENNEETKRYLLLNNGAKKVISRDEYRFLLQVVHPDRAPADRADTFSKAFKIIMRLKEYSEA